MWLRLRSCLRGRRACRGWVWCWPRAGPSGSDPSPGGGSKALLRLGGLNLVERAVQSLLAAGVASVVVVVGYDAGPVAAVVEPAGARPGPGRLRRPMGHGNGASLAAVEDAVAGEALFVLLTADHVFGDGAIDRLLATGAPAVLVDASPVLAAWGEGTRVRVVDGAVVALGKHLDEPGIDCGAFLLPPDIFRCQAQAAAEGDHTLAGAVTGLAQERPLRAVALPGGCWWQDVDTPEDARAAAAALRGSLGKQADGPVSRWLNRPLSTRLSMALAPAAARSRPRVAGRLRARHRRRGAACGRAGRGRRAAGPRELGRRRRRRGGRPAPVTRQASGGAARRRARPGRGRRHPGRPGAVGARTDTTRALCWR